MNAPEVIPTTAQAMAQAKRWLLWRLIPQRTGKPKKMPYYADGGVRGKGIGLDTPEDIARLVTYDEAQAALTASHQGNSPYQGVGFALGPDGSGNCWQGIDFDGISDRPQLLKLAEEMQGYRETSPSGNGLHWIGYGPTVFANLPNHEGIEAYSSGRFFTVTMAQVIDSPVVDIGPLVLSKLAPLRAAAAQPARVKGFPPAVHAPRADVDIGTLVETLARIPVIRLGYFDWFKVFAGVHHQFHDHPEAKAAVDALNEWSKGTPDQPDKRYDGERDVVKKWNSLGHNPRFTAPGAARTWKTVKVLAEKHTPAKFGPAEAEAARAAPAQPPERPFGLMTIGEFVGNGSMEQGWLIKGVLPAGALVQYYGAPGSGKTFSVIDLMMHVAMGEPWNGHRTRAGNVVYIAAEGVAGARKRLRAYGIHHGIPVELLPIAVMTMAPNILEEETFMELGRTLAQLGDVDLVVVDTLAQTMPGANENSSEGMGKAIARYTELVHALNCTVAMIHHDGKAEEAGARGWSGQVGALDTQFRITSDKLTGVRSMAVTKQKDGESGQVYAFRLRVVDLGMDRDGDPITSCAASFICSATEDDHGDASEHRSPAQPGWQFEQEVKGKWRNRVWLHIRQAVSMGLPLRHNDVVEAVFQATPPEEGKRDRRRDNITRAIGDLVDANLISYMGGMIVPFDPENRKATLPDSERHEV